MCGYNEKLFIRKDPGQEIKPGGLFSELATEARGAVSDARENLHRLFNFVRRPNPEAREQLLGKFIINSVVVLMAIGAWPFQLVDKTRSRLAEIREDFVTRFTDRH